MRFPPFRAWAQRIWRLGPSRLALGLAILLALIALASPLWSLAWVSGGDRVISSYSWTTVTTDTYLNGNWDGTLILPYTSGFFSFDTVAGVLATAYVLVVVFILLIIAVAVLFTLERTRRMSTLTLLVMSLLVVGVGLSALLYPIVAIPGAATTDVGTFTVAGFWGSTRTTAPSRDWSWGAGVGWWLLLVSVVFGIIGAALPYLRSIRAMVPPPPEDWQPPSR